MPSVVESPAMAAEEKAFLFKEPDEALLPAEKTSSSTRPSEEKVQSSCNGNDITVGVLEAPAAACDDPSLKSPVTPAPVNEYDGSPALRWKSYSGNLREAPSSKSASDPKGKLVINLSGNPRAFVKLSPAPSLIKPFTSEDLNENKNPSNSHSESSQGTLVENSEKSVSVSNNVEAAVVAGTNCNSVSAPSSGDGTISEIAKKVRLRVKRSRIPVKPNLFQRRAEESEFNLPLKNLEERMPMVEAPVRDIAEPATRASEHAPSFLASDKGHATLDYANEDTPANIAPGELQIPKEAVCGEIESLEKKKPQEVSLSGNIGSSHGLTCDDNAGSMPKEMIDADNDDQEADTIEGSNKYEPLESLAGVEVASLADTHVDKEQVAPEPLSSEQPHLSTVGCASRENRGRHMSRAPSVSGYDNGTTSETSKFDMKDRTILDTLLPDEPPGYSSGGCSEPSRVHEPGRDSDVECSQSEDSESGDSQSEKEDAESSRSEGYDDEESYSEESEDVDACIPSKGLSPGTPHRGALFSEQVPSVLCDAEGNVWHIGKRAEQARGTKVLQGSHPVEVVSREKIAPIVRQGEVEKEHLEKTSPPSEVVPYNHLIQLNWRWPSDADYTFSIVPDAANRSMVVKEKSVFVGCIPDGVEHLEEHLRSLMEKFLVRFDFAPAQLGHIQVVKVVKDFAFLELATEKVAQIVLAANQLDVYEWGVNGYHLNIQGCSGTHSSVRPLIEYVPLKPSRVILVSNIPKSRWQKDYLEAFFSRLLRGSDGASPSKLVSAAYLLPESCDAYVEFASDLMAESLIYKCTKNPLLLKDIGEDVFICRDASSVPLMSRHKGVINPQRSLFIGVSPRGEEFKIDCVRKVFEEILPLISRELNQPGYLEYIYTLPGKDYAFFQFNSAAIVDAIMDEYIDNTQIFVCKSSPVPYVILRPPEYVRPGAKMSAYMDCKPQSGFKRQFLKKGPSFLEMQERSVSEQPGKFVTKAPRRFGDEPVKKPDCLMSIGASASPLVTWNGLSFLGACSADPDSVLVVEGLPKGISYKLLRGALNEAFERSLSRTGLLEVGMLVLRYLDRDGNFDVVASLPSPNFVAALLSMRQPFVIAGHEIRLFPKEGRRIFSRSIDMLGAQGDLSCLTDEDAGQVKRFRKYPGDEWIGPVYGIERKNGRTEVDHKFVSMNGPSSRKVQIGLDRDEWKGASPLPKQLGIKAHYKEMRRLQNGVLKKRGGSKLVQRSLPDLNWMGSSPSAVKLPQSRMGRGNVQVKDGSSSFTEYPKDVLKIVAMEGRREVQSASGPFVVRDIGMPVGKVLARSIKKRKPGGQASPVFNLGLAQKRFKKRPQFS